MSSRIKKIFLGGLLATASIGAIVGVSVGLNSNTTTSVGTSNNNGSHTITQTIVSKDGYSLSIQARTTATNPDEVKYVAIIDQNNKKEGVIYFVTKDGEQSQELEFQPGDELTIKAIMNDGYENYTVRDLKVYGSNENHFVPSKNVDGQTNTFKVKMPKYNDTLDLSGESWLYAEGTAIKVIPTFIKSSIGTDVNWEHGAYYDDLNGYVYNVKQDSNWSTLWSNLYSTIPNEDITNPINIYIYLQGHKITLDEENVQLDVPSGWSLNFMNNKYDSIQDGKYGELYVPTGKKSKFTFKGTITLGSSVKYNSINSGDGVTFIDFDNTSWYGTIKNDPNA
ncbi:hypothetical protein [Malacoplasma iowae]|uniref:Uncharacterized protein n=1 Tax=Malacoplasma iowae 695 TaxID=1048830 RepID=A0A6P1LDY3_MALIO|nr:hypothetical protein [Malacoplasma iowae]VEU63441.1 Uncharacterised protein [Mycoplasmopsis fermentans]EGZ30828.1 hypothetical protein GUU_04963 [Malacoplasma iowae 695]QHG89679.1 hypothetical protein EER00_02075 [Malacoplasma iowae 695]WPL35531.1 hypothetical protein QX180_04365 [Malacoplasma iowae]VEU72163.1 Uncharacterised protein [Malacoplasma iowae]